MKRSKKSAPSSKTIRKNPKHNLLSPWSKAFVHRFQNALAKERILPPRAKILVAVSGGPDSLALLLLLSLLAHDRAWELRVAHVNYGLRGKDSELDEAFVRNTTKNLGLPFSVLRSKARLKKNIEALLRDIRYIYFEKLRKKFNFDYIVTAHTMNDLAETVLMNLVRGSGEQGLSPFARERDSLVRPLIHFKREEILRFLQEQKVKAQIDKSNASLAFTRNRIRHTLLPLLEKEFNPNIVPVLARTAKILGKQEKKNASPLIIEKKGATVYLLARQDFLALSPSAGGAFLARFLRTKLGHAPSQAFLQELLQAIRSEKSKVQSVGRQGLKVRVFHATIELAFSGKSE